MDAPQQWLARWYFFRTLIWTKIPCISALQLHRIPAGSGSLEKEWVTASMFIINCICFSFLGFKVASYVSNGTCNSHPIQTVLCLIQFSFARQQQNLHRNINSTHDAMSIVRSFWPLYKSIRPTLNSDPWTFVIRFATGVLWIPNVAEMVNTAKHKWIKDDIMRVL